MNYNRSCYNRQSDKRYCPTRPMDNCQTPIQPRYTDNRNYDTANTAEMNYRLAMVYSPYQEWQNIYCGEKALENGTLFAELNKPFAGYKCTKGVCQL